MDRDTFESAANIFVDAAALDSSLQEAFVEKACAGNAELLSEVRSLLNAAQGADEYFSGLSKRLGIATSEENPPDAAATAPAAGRQGLVIGAYTLTEVIGSGGAGTVWRAGRTDGQFEGHVAVKIVNPVAATVASADRLRDEAQHLAKLSHPSIARLLDAGVDSENHPYLVLEFIDGSPIDLYCNTHFLSISRRIKLFIDVLRAVAHAHAHLIVHRDIKPSNVLVDKEGNVKLLDFGIAKLLHAETGKPGAALTVDPGSALTPDYAAPEQLLGQAVTTATDVYALGLMLYKLLSGHNPRDSATIDSFAALIEVATQDTPKASTLASHAERRNTSQQSLQRTLRGDLDNILQKALAPEPAERYSTATAFTSDLERFLDGETVSAMPPTVGYRARKFVGRHRGGVATTLLTAIALVVSLIIATSQMLAAERQRDAALYQQQRVQASNEFYSLLFEEMGSNGNAFTAVELLDRGANLLRQQYDIEQPFIGRIHYDLSRRYSNLKERNRELELLGLAEAAARASNDNDLLAAALCSTANAFLFSDPERAKQNVVDGNRALSQVRSPSIDSRIACLRMDAHLAEADGDREHAMEILIGVQRQLDDDPAPATHLRGITLNDLGILYAKEGRYDEALETIDKILSLLDGSGRGSTLGYWQVLSNRSAILGTVGEIAAESVIKERLFERLRESSWRDDRAQIVFSIQYGNTLVRLSRYNEGIGILQSARKEAESLGNDIYVAMADLGLAVGFVATDRFDEAQPKLSGTEKALAKNPTAWKFQIVRIAVLRASIARKQGHLVEARERLQTLLSNYGYPPLQKAPSALAAVLRAASLVELDAENYVAAEQLASDYLASKEHAARRPNSSAVVGNALFLRAKARIGLSNSTGAINDLTRAVISLENGLGVDNPETVEARSLLQSIQASL